MEAGSDLRRFLFGLTTALLMATFSSSAVAGNMRTQNFIVAAPTQQLAEAVGQAAEKYRRDLAMHWLGTELPPWPTPCPIRVIAGPNLAAQGVTTYNPRPVRDFQMEVVGTPERILDSVLPHEVTHTILATYFGRPLPRWADEGICTTVEHVSERSKHEAKLREFLQSRRGIAMNQLFLLTEYPSDVLPMYAQGYSVCRFLIDQKGPRTFIHFLKDYMRHPSWTTNVKKHYQYDSLAELQEYWLAWVADGSDSVEKFAKVQPAPVRPASVASVNALASSTVQQASATTPVAKSPSPMTVTQPRPGQLQPVQIQPAQTRPAQVRPAQTQLAQSRPPKPPVGAATALASTTGQGWYARKRQEAQTDQTNQGRGIGPATGQLSSVGTPMVPPSVRDSGPYQTAHPQPEQQISRGPDISRARRIPPNQPISPAAAPDYRILDGGVGNLTGRFR